MKRRPRCRPRARSAHGAAASCAALLLLAADPGIPSAAAQQPPDSVVARMQAQMLQANTPGEAHARLAALEGLWTQEVRIRPAHGAEVTVLEGTAENRMILGGRFLESRGRSGEGVYATEALTILGVDLRSGHYTTVGFDTWGTYFVTGRGPYDAERRQASMPGTDANPLLGHTQEYRFELQWLDADSYAFRTVFTDEAHTAGQGPLTMVEVIHRRSRP
jgi:hypothetical protein